MRFRFSINKLSRSIFLPFFSYSSYVLGLINQVNPSVFNRNCKDEDIRHQSKATSPVVVLKYYDPPVATATLLFDIWAVIPTRHHLIVTWAFVWFGIVFMRGASNQSVAGSLAWHFRTRSWWSTLQVIYCGIRLVFWEHVSIKRRGYYERS